ncbi:MAG: hypothetical protein Q8Q92_04360 [bacterium]|nr:hypothetical protein [bacterium]
MIWFFSLMVLVAVILVVLTVEFLIPRSIIALGKVDSWWSPFRTLPPPGKMYIIVRGAPNGPFDTVIESVSDYNYDPVTREFLGPIITPSLGNDYLSNLGVAWVGFWRHLFHLEPESKTYTDLSIFFRHNLKLEIKTAETVGNLPVSAVIVYTVHIINPVKAFFFAGGWEAQVNAAVQGRFRKYVSDKRIDQLREEHKSGGLTLIDEIKALGERDPTGTNHNLNGLYALFGVEIIDVRFVLFDLMSGDEGITRAVRALEIATLNAEASAKDGEGERRKRQERAVGVRAEVEAWGANPVGGTVAMAEAIKEAKPNVLGGSVIASVDAKK